MKILLALFVTGLCFAQGGNQGGGNPYTSQPDPDVVNQDPCNPSNDIEPPPGPVPCADPDCLDSALISYQAAITAINAETCGKLGELNDLASDMVDAIVNDYTNCIIQNPDNQGPCEEELLASQDALNSIVNNATTLFLTERRDAIADAAFDYWQTIGECCNQ